jgi:putative oxidoreductase
VGALNTVHPGWGIFVVRVVAGIILIVAGYSKFAGGIGGFAGFLGQAGFPAPELTAPLIATWELITGLLLLVGLGTRWVALLMMIEFLTTTFIVKLPRAGWDNSRIDMMMLAAGVLFLLAGPGKAAVDEMMARKRGVGYGEPARV